MSEFVIKKRFMMSVILSVVKILREKQGLSLALILAFDESFG